MNERYATMPHGMSTRDRSLLTLGVGDSGWTVPWAMYHDEDRRLWLDGNYSICAQPGGTVQMLVRRDEEGWHVDASGVPEGERAWGGATGATGTSIPVATFTVDEAPR